jgi:hypothetical protein
MYPGHFATALVMRRAAPRAPLLGLLVGVGLLDLLFGLFVMAGLEGGNDQRLIYPWSHSAAMALLWATAYAACFARRGWRVSAWMFAAVASHWVLDVLVHRPSLGLWPYSGIELGLQSRFGGLGGWMELATTLAGCAWYVRSALRAGPPRPRWQVSVLFLAFLYALEFATARQAP